MQRPATIAENGYVATLSYDDGGERVKMVLTNNGTTQLTRYYLEGQYELDAETGTERLYLGGSAYSAPMVYVKEAGNWNIYYICRDYQGSITHIVNANGSLKQELSYDPWGRLRDPNSQLVYVVGAEPTLFLARGYTGHEHLSVFGLINMNARLYDPALGRFLSPDSYVQSPDNSQSFNRYSYCLNNPLKYSDPTGLLTWNDVIAGFAFIAGVALEFVPGMQWLGTALIVTGFSHFAYTINQVQNSYGQIGWNEASNNAGINFGGSINFNGPTSKEKNYNNENTSAGSEKLNIENYPDSRFFQGSDYDAAMLSKMLTENDCGIEHPYMSTSNGFYFEPTSGYKYNGQDANGENRFSFHENGLNYYADGTKKSISLNYNDESFGYINVGTVMNRVRINYESHYHPWDASMSPEDEVYSISHPYPLFAICGTEYIRYALNGGVYNSWKTIFDLRFGRFNMNIPW